MRENRRKRPAPPQRRPIRDNPTADHSKGYEDAALHLLDHGLMPAANLEGLRLMWRRGGHSRQAAAVIAQAWDLAA
jgi:hypothetical protein